MKVLVTGGTGFIGRNLCRELDDRGHEVTALARSPGGADLPASVETAVGDVTAYDSVEAAFEGQDAAVNLVALSPLYKPSGGNEMHDVVHRGGTENCVRAAEEHGVDRFAQMSNLNADPDAPTALLRAKGNAERIVRESDLQWTIFRPSVVFGDGGEFVGFTKTVAPPYVTPLPGGGETRFQPIWVGDLVPLVADALEDDRHVGEIYELGGPEVLTLADVAREIHGAAGRPVTVIPLPMWLAAAGLAIGEKIPGFPLGLDQYRGLKFVDDVPDENDVAAFGVDPSAMKTLGAYLADG